MYLQNCGLRTFSYEILSKEVLACENIRFSAAKSVEKRMFSQAEEVFFFSAFLPVSEWWTFCSEHRSLNKVLWISACRYQINFYRFVPIKLHFERLANDSVLHGTVWKSHRYRIAINTPRFRVCNQIFSCMVKLLSTYRVKVPQCMGSPLFWLVETYCTQITH